MSSGAAGGVAATHLLYSLFPLPPGYVVSGPSFDELNERIGARAKRAELVGFGIGVVFAVVCCLLIAALRGVIYSRFPLGTPFLLKPTPEGWWLAIGSGGALAVLTAMTLAPMRLFGAEYPDYVRLSRLKAAFRIDQANRLLLAVFAVTTLLLTAFVADNYTIIGRDSITLNPFFSLGATRHTYNDVERIVTAPQLVAPNGKVVDRRIYVIHFRGGDRWSSDNGPGLDDEDMGRKAEIAQYVSKRSGVPITEVPVFQKGES